MPCTFQGKEGVVADNLHPQIQCRIGNLYANRTQTDDTQGLARNFRTGEFLLACLYCLFHAFAVVLQPLYPSCPCNDASGGCKQSCQNQLLYGVCICPRRIEYGNALLCTFFNGDVVCACACTGNGKQAFVQLHLVHIKAAQDDALRIFCFFINHEILFGQLCQPCFCNVVQSANGIHNVSPF